MRAARVLVAAALVASLSGCQNLFEPDYGPSIDDELWRQGVFHSDPMWGQLNDRLFERGSIEEVMAFFADRQLAARFWDESADPEELGLADGGIAYWGVEQVGEEARFSFMLSTGIRDKGRDGSLDPWPYTGPVALAACAVVSSSTQTIVSGDDTFTHTFLDRQWWRDNAECPQELLDTLVPGVEVVHIDEFAG